MSAERRSGALAAVAEPRNLLGGSWVLGEGASEPVFEPATGEQIYELRAAGERVVADAVASAAAALPGWSRTPVTQRSRALLRLARLLAEREAELAALITLDNGKTLTDAGAEIQRAIDHLEAAATAPALLTGYGAQDVATGVDASVMREPVGVCAVVAPFNFPIMTGLIYHAWALACGNAVVLKPSEQAPLATCAFAALFEEAGFPAGVFNLVHGGRETVEALVDHPEVAAISLVGSTAAARAVYARAAERGKRVHSAGGARNFLVVMPDADLDTAAAASVASVFGMAGQRCLSSSVLVAVGEVGEDLVERVVDGAAALTVGSGFDPATDVPPLISRQSVERLRGVVDAAEQAGAEVRLDGREVEAGAGFFAGPTVLSGLGPESPAVTTETFGPLLTVLSCDDLAGAVALCNSSPFGNAASVFTASGGIAREFTRAVDVGNIGVNVGVAAPTGQFAFGGRKDSFFGTVHSQGREAVEFYTDRKSLTVRWP